MITVVVNNAICEVAYGFTVRAGRVQLRGKDRRTVLAELPLAEVEIDDSHKVEFWYHCADPGSIPLGLREAVADLDDVAYRTPAWDVDGLPRVTIRVPAHVAPPEWRESPQDRANRLLRDIEAVFDKT